jgi:hypothetical protein
MSSTCPMMFARNGPLHMFRPHPTGDTTMTMSRTFLAAIACGVLGATAAAAEGIRSDNGPLSASIYQTIREQQGVAQPGAGRSDFGRDAASTTGSTTREAPIARNRARQAR